MTNYRYTETHRGKPFRVLDAESTSSLVKTAGISKDRTSEHKFDVLLSAEAKAGGYQEKLILKTDNAELRDLEIVIAAMLR